MSDERLMILKMVEEGKITAEEAMNLLSAVDSAAKKEKLDEALSGMGARAGASGKFFRVRVTDAATGKVKVNVRMPLSVVQSGIRMGRRFRPEVDGLDLDDLDSFIQNGLTGQVVDIDDEKQGEHIEVFIE